MTDMKLKAFIVNLLRGGTFKWKPRGEAKKRFKVQVGVFKTSGNPKYGYLCQKCQEVFLSKDVQMDHLHAVVNPITGFTTLDDYVARMFCYEDGFISLCSDCHDQKTKIEGEYRVKFRALNKAGESDPELEEEYYNFLKEYT